MKYKLSGLMPSFADELSKIQKGEPSLAHLIFGLGGIMLAMYLGSRSAETRGQEKRGAAQQAARTNSQSKARPSKTQFDSGFDGYTARYIGPMI
jgi:hypothetical protein